jgi:segregation and condensation protein A
VVVTLPDITLKELLLAFNDAVRRSSMFAHHHVSREALSVRERMTEILVTIQNGDKFVEFSELFRPEEGRMGVAVTFLAILELLKESLIDVVQPEAYGRIHIRAAQQKEKEQDSRAAEPG